MLPQSPHLSLLPEKQGRGQDAQDGQDADEAEEQELLGALGGLLVPCVSDQDERALACHPGVRPVHGAVVGTRGRRVTRLEGDGTDSGVGLVLTACTRLAADLLHEAGLALEVHVEVADYEVLELGGVGVGDAAAEGDGPVGQRDQDGEAGVGHRFKVQGT